VIQAILFSLIPGQKANLLFFQNSYSQHARRERGDNGFGIAYKAWDYFYEGRE
jgi:hypothetical protein